jgi:hypothetical protein
MSFTRFHDDPCRIKKQMQESTGLGKYMLNVPGNGDKPCFMEGPFIRLQQWGANLRTNTINLESDLIGLTRSNTKDCIDKNQYNKHNVSSSSVSYPTCLPVTDQSRATHPAWTARDLEQVNWYILPLNPQENTCMPFHNNLSTRIIERDNFVAKAPCSLNLETGTEGVYSRQFSGNGRAPGPLCNSTNSCGNVISQ